MGTNERRTATKTDPKGVVPGATTSSAADTHPPKVAHLSPEERKARGKAARNEVPLERHADFAPQARPDPIDFLEEQAKTRVPELVPIRYGRMGVSPFTFYRGAALIMASDLSGTPNSGLHAQLCGDAHLSNFGIYGSPERRMVFDINDFDETSVGPWEWDVKRLAASVEIGGTSRRLHGQEAPSSRGRGRERVPHRDAVLRSDAEPRAVVRAHRRRAAAAGDQGRGPRRSGEAIRQGGREDEDPRQHAGLHETDRDGRRGATDPEPAAVDRPAPGTGR